MLVIRFISSCRIGSWPKEKCIYNDRKLWDLFILRASFCPLRSLVPVVQYYTARCLHLVFYCFFRHSMGPLTMLENILVIEPFEISLFILLIDWNIILRNTGKEASSYYWHGRDSSTIRELNPKVFVILNSSFALLCWSSLSYQHEYRFMNFSIINDWSLERLYIIRSVVWMISTRSPWGLLFHLINKKFSYPRKRSLVFINNLGWFRFSCRYVVRWKHLFFYVVMDFVVVIIQFHHWFWEELGSLFLVQLYKSK